MPPTTLRGSAWSSAGNRRTSSSTMPTLRPTNNGVVSGIFAATGQTCIAGSRLFVQERAHDELVERLSEKAGTIKLGDPLEMETEMGPVAFKEQLDKVQGYIEVGQEEGAELVFGGKRPRTEG